jgi:hypothetical protein
MAENANNANVNDETNLLTESRFRNVLAYVLTILSIGGLGWICYLIINILNRAPTVPPADTDKIMTIFTTVVALVGTWVGTILAFYFSRENFEAAAKSSAATTAALVKQLTPGEKLAATLVKDKMIKRSEMFFVRTPNESINLTKTLEDLEKTGKGNRIPLLDENDKPVCVLHRSTIVEYLFKKTRSIAPPDAPANPVIQSPPVVVSPPAAGLPPAAIDPATLTMKDLMADWEKDPKLTEMLKNSFALVKESANLGDAKAAMDSRKGCQDVFVTKTGSGNEPVLGWVTNVTISENAVSWE